MAVIGQHVGLGGGDGEVLRQVWRGGLSVNGMRRRPREYGLWSWRELKLSLALSGKLAYYS